MDNRPDWLKYRSMEQNAPSLLEQTLALWEQLQASAQNLLLPSRLSQIGILIALAGAAFLIERWLGPKMHEWMRTLEGWPKWRLRTLIVLHNRLRLIFFTLFTKFIT